jgi:hypothetical protein
MSFKRLNEKIVPLGFLKGVASLIINDDEQHLVFYPIG